MQALKLVIKMSESQVIDTTAAYLAVASPVCRYVEDFADLERELGEREMTGDQRDDTLKTLYDHYCKYNRLEQAEHMLLQRLVLRVNQVPYSTVFLESLKDLVTFYRKKKPPVHRKEVEEVLSTLLPSLSQTPLLALQVELKYGLCLFYWGDRDASKSLFKRVAPQLKTLDYTYWSRFQWELHRLYSNVWAVDEASRCIWRLFKAAYSIHRNIPQSIQRLTSLHYYLSRFANVQSKRVYKESWCDYLQSILLEIDITNTEMIPLVYKIYEILRLPVLVAYPFQCFSADSSVNGHLVICYFYLSRLYLDFHTPSKAIHTLYTGLRIASQYRLIYKENYYEPGIRLLVGMKRYEEVERMWVRYERGRGHLKGVLRDCYQ